MKKSNIINSDKRHPRWWCIRLAPLLLPCAVVIGEILPIVVYGGIVSVVEGIVSGDLLKLLFFGAIESGLAPISFITGAILAIVGIYANGIIRDGMVICFCILSFIFMACGFTVILQFFSI